jgi:sulfite reductase (ferredoxin)
MAKETAAQRVERIKRERPSWSILDDILRYAREGFAAIPDDNLTVRMRAWGLYTQGDGDGVRGDAVPYFMMRVRTPNGALTARMAATIADLSERYARGTLDVTNRQNFQLHWLTIEDIPVVWEALAEVGWTSQGSCGDNTRTVTGCPLAGIDAGELVDASPLAVAVDRHMNGNPVFANLPRKFKITITGCGQWCTYPEINDIGLTAVRRGEEVGFSLRVGGGLSTRPHLARRLDAFVPWGLVPEVVEAVAAVFRDSDELRVNRAKARMKCLFLVQGWTEERFLAAVEERLGYRLDRSAPEQVPAGAFRDHVGIIPQKQDGLFAAGFSIAAGRITPWQLRAVAELAERYGDGGLRTTIMQNVVVLGIPERNLAAFARAAERAGLPITGSAFRRGTIACTGSEYCKLAIVETKQFALGLIEELERRVPGFEAQIKLHVTGCPNACGQHWIADVGLQGVRVPGDKGQEVDGFEVFVGGGLGRGASVARRVGVRVPSARAAQALEGLFHDYMKERLDDGESFRAWVERVGDARAKAALGRYSESREPE